MRNSRSFLVCCVQTSWPALIASAVGQQVDLTAEGWFNDFGDTDPFKYFVYAAAVSTVEVDVLTGEIEVCALKCFAVEMSGSVHCFASDTR